jgi:hypothetical protein
MFLQILIIARTFLNICNLCKKVTRLVSVANNLNPKPAAVMAGRSF